MSLATTGTAPGRLRIALGAVMFCTLAIALLAPASSDAGTSDKKRPKITVMSRNVYLGADLGPAINAGSICEAVDAAGGIVNDVDESDFTERAPLLAKEIAKAGPDLVGLQEAALWRDQPNSDYTATPAGHVRYDFLKLLTKQLKKRGVPYEVVVSQDEFDEELPADVDGSDATGNGPLAGCGADIDGRLTMRDAILRRKDSKVQVSDPDKGQFENQYEVLLGGAVPIDVERGWVSTEAKLPATERTRGAGFHFVNTHLEAFGDPQIREDQARELFAKGGPLRTRKQLLFVGDINSGSKNKDKIGPPFTHPGDRGAYKALVNDFGMTNRGTRQTCCYPDVFTDLIGDYRFDHTVDHVMAKPPVPQLDAGVTGADPKVNSPSGLVSSDHGGLWSTLLLK